MNDNKAAGWSNLDDIRNDLWSLTDFNNRPANKTNAAVIKSRREKYYKDDSDDEEAEYCWTGRGKMIESGRYLRQPGTSKTFDDYSKHIREQIRQVSGIGFTNDTILHNLGYKRTPIACDEIFQDVECAAGTSKEISLHDLIKNRTNVKNEKKTKNGMETHISYDAEFPPIKQ